MDLRALCWVSLAIISVGIVQNRSLKCVTSVRFMHGSFKHRSLVPLPRSVHNGSHFAAKIRVVIHIIWYVRVLWSMLGVEFDDDIGCNI